MAEHAIDPFDSRQTTSSHYITFQLAAKRLTKTRRQKHSKKFSPPTIFLPVGERGLDPECPATVMELIMSIIEVPYRLTTERDGLPTKEFGLFRVTNSPPGNNRRLGLFAAIRPKHDYER